MVKEIECRRWFLGKNVAIVIYPYVFYNMGDDRMFDWYYREMIRRHEAIHVKQILQKLAKFPKVFRWVGWVWYYLDYVWGDMIVRWFKNRSGDGVYWGKYEAAAYKGQHDTIQYMDFYTGERQ